MRQEWSPEDVVACWTLVDGDWDLVVNKTGPTRLGFCLMLKFFEMEGRFPEFIEEFPQPAVEYVAGLVKVPATELAKYDLAGAKRHRKQIREALKFRPATLDDEERLAAWLAVEVCPVELVEDRQREALLVECRARKIEPPGRTRIENASLGAPSPHPCGRLRPCPGGAEVNPAPTGRCLYRPWGPTGQPVSARLILNGERTLSTPRGAAGTRLPLAVTPVVGLVALFTSREVSCSSVWEAPRSTVGWCPRVLGSGTDLGSRCGALPRRSIARDWLV
ncbi:DUF4158 domain-containing protein [Streptomyces sp. NPDC002012]|uniref:DUF4158 domain-containing protein n=1 Tax=Streptomyces sp. NPDC002012 TaxID=3154532 RepID=UPI00331D56E1